MLQQTEFMPQRQFHVLISNADREHRLTVLPDQRGRFRVIEQGKVLGEVDFTPQHTCVRRKGRLKKSVVSQLENHIKNYYSQFKSLLV
jgi:hypothetical protein